MIRLTRKHIRIRGVTQGVGFRPFVWRLARRLGLSGWVLNDSAGLRFEIQGNANSVDEFLIELQRNPPPLARLDSVEVDEVPAMEAESEFVIRESKELLGQSNPVTQDIAVCADCLGELNDVKDRRYRYPFINCTNCGPRFTIVEDLPYDRTATTMKSFPMCPLCQAEYNDPSNRRFHAQPNACSTCGPAVWFWRSEYGLLHEGTTKPDAQCHGDPIDICSAAILSGQIVALKGIGGFHLVCDPGNEAAVKMLRERKGRVEKPFAVMAKNVEQIREFAAMDQSEQTLLESKERPIVLLRKNPQSTFEQMLKSVAPGNDFVGAMLPYSPLHHLLLETVSPLVVTSGNIADEPIVRTNEEATARLAKLADGFLFHDREIHVVCDDSVVRSVDGGLLPIRRSRGYAPLPVRLCETGPSVLAVGGEIKATFCITKNNYAYLSQHIGDVGNIETLDALQQNVDHFRKLFRVKVEAIAGDLHPEYLSTQWARKLAAELNVPFVPVQHHFAHAASLVAEHQVQDGRSMIVCCFDGTGYGTDGAIWGGEFLLANDKEFERLAHLRYFSLPGGDAAVKRPFRVALALLSQFGLDWNERIPSVATCSKADRSLLRKQIDGQLNCPITSSIGRLFDAISSLIGIRQNVTYEAQAAMEMEALASESIDDVDPIAYSFSLTHGGPIEVCSSSIVRSVCDDVVRGVAPAIVAAKFHHAVANMIGAVCEELRRVTRLNSVGLTGGVFQNVLLLRLAKQKLQQQGFQVFSHSVVPPNDGGIALGQAVVARNWLRGGAGPKST